MAVPKYEEQIIEVPQVEIVERIVEVPEVQVSPLVYPMFSGFVLK